MESRLSDFTGRKKEVNEESKAQQFQGTVYMKAGRTLKGHLLKGFHCPLAVRCHRNLKRSAVLSSFLGAVRFQIVSAFPKVSLVQVCLGRQDFHFISDLSVKLAGLSAPLCLY